MFYLRRQNDGHLDQFRVAISYLSGLVRTKPFGQTEGHKALQEYK